MAPSHNLNQWWPSILMDISTSQPQLVNKPQGHKCCPHARYISVITSIMTLSSHISLFVTNRNSYSCRGQSIIQWCVWQCTIPQHPLARWSIVLYPLEGVMTLENDPQTTPWACLLAITCNYWIAVNTHIIQIPPSHSTNYALFVSFEMIPILRQNKLSNLLGNVENAVHLGMSHFCIYIQLFGRFVDNETE